MKRTDIEWTARVLPDGTTEPGLSANPLKYRDQNGNVVWACVKKSSGCASCYAEAIALRFDRGAAFTRANMEGLTPFVCDQEVRHILTAKQIGGLPVAGSKCFAGDMTDWFGEWVPDALLDRLFAAIALRPDVTFQVLTKRADRMAAYFATPDRKKLIAEQAMPISNMLAAAAGSHRARLTMDQFRDAFVYQGPMPNLWVGCSVESQAAADARIPHLLKVPAAVRFLSCEPLLGEVDLVGWGESRMTNDPAAEPATWAGYPWPEWVPARERQLVEEFWLEAHHRNPRQWMESARENRVPALGGLIGATVGESGWGDLCPARSPLATVTGRYVHMWNNIGRLVTAGGEVVPVSSARGTGWLSKWRQPDGGYAHRLHLAIVGCESGPKRRPMAEQWAASLVEQCRAAGVASFTKQVEVGGRVTGEIAEFPQQLQVRNYPRPAA